MFISSKLYSALRYGLNYVAVVTCSVVFICFLLCISIVITYFEMPEWTNCINKILSFSLIIFSGCMSAFLLGLLMVFLSDIGKRKSERINNEINRVRGIITVLNSDSWPEDINALLNKEIFSKMTGDELIRHREYCVAYYQSCLAVLEEKLQKCKWP